MKQSLDPLNNKVLLFFLFILIVHNNCLNAQLQGDYRSKQTGLWTDVGTWETYNGIAWVAASAYPTYKNGHITITEFDTVIIKSDTLDLDQITISTNGRLTLKNSAKVNLRNNKGDDLVCDGYLLINNSGVNFISNSSLVNNNYGTINLQSGSIIQGKGSLTNTGNISLNADFMFSDSIIFNCNNGSIRGLGNLTVQGTMNYANCDINVPLIITKNAFLNANPEYNAYLTDITNNGTINWNSGSADFYPKSVVNNNSQFNIHSNTSLTNYRGGHPTINNSSSGKIEISSDYYYDTRITLDINNEGSVIIDSGSLVTSGSFHNYKTIRIAQNASYENDGTIYEDSSETLEGKGDFYNAGIDYINYTDTLSKKLSFYSSGWLKGTGQLIIPGTIQFGGNSLIPITITETGTGIGLITQVYTTFINNGKLTLSGGNANISGQLINNGLITVSELPVLRKVGLTSSFINNGEIKVIGGYGSGFSTESPFTNSFAGVLEGSGSFHFVDVFINEGSISPGVKAPASLTFFDNPLQDSTILYIGIGVKKGKTIADKMVVDYNNITLTGTLNLFQMNDVIDTGSYSIITCDYDKKITGSFSKIIKPDNWTIEYQSSAVIVHVTSTGLRNGINANTNIIAKDLKDDGNVVLYPNPVGNTLHIMNLSTSTDNKLSITDINGKLLATVVVKGLNYNWRIENIANGIYYLIVETNAKTHTQKFVKQ